MQARLGRALRWVGRVLRLEARGVTWLRWLVHDDKALPRMLACSATIHSVVPIVVSEAKGGESNSVADVASYMRQQKTVN